MINSDELLSFYEIAYSFLEKEEWQVIFIDVEKFQKLSEEEKIQNIKENLV